MKRCKEKKNEKELNIIISFQIATYALEASLISTRPKLKIQKGVSYCHCYWHPFTTIKIFIYFILLV